MGGAPSLPAPQNMVRRTALLLLMLVISTSHCIIPLSPSTLSKNIYQKFLPQEETVASNLGI